MVELDGQSYTINTPQENAAAAIRWVNQFCIDNEVRNSKGEIASLEIAPGSPLYLILLGFGYLASLCQNILFGLGRMLNIGESSNRQLVALGEILRMRRKPESYTTIKALVYASDEGTLLITTSLTASIQIGRNLVVFSPLYDVTIYPGSVAVVLLQATSLGSFFLEPNAITAFDENPLYMSRMTTQSSLPGRPQETYDAFRRRIQSRSTAFSGIEKCVQALRDLSGVSAANIYFNMSNVNQTIQGYNVDPRKAIAFIQGYSPDIAKTIFSYLLCDMMPLTVSQNTTLNNGQTLTAYWDTPVFVPLIIRVFIVGNISVTTSNAIVSAVQSLALEVDVASAVTTADILRVVQSQVPEALITGAHMKLNADDPWRQRLVAGSNEMFEFNRANIEVTNVT